VGGGADKPRSCAPQWNPPPSPPTRRPAAPPRAPRLRRYAPFSPAENRPGENGPAGGPLARRRRVPRLTKKARVSLHAPPPGCRARSPKAPTGKASRARQPPRKTSNGKGHAPAGVCHPRAPAADDGALEKSAPLFADANRHAIGPRARKKGEDEFFRRRADRVPASSRNRPRRSPQPTKSKPAALTRDGLAQRTPGKRCCATVPRNSNARTREFAPPLTEKHPVATGRKQRPRGEKKAARPHCRKRHPHRLRKDTAP